MAVYPDTELQLPLLRKAALSSASFPAAATLAAVLGLFSIWPTLSALWQIWTTDALNSIGMLVPAVSLGLVLVAWRKLGWRSDGNWWGLAVLLVNFGITCLLQHGVFLLVLSTFWTTRLPPFCAQLFLYGSGVVLLLGGTRLFRVSMFPLFLLWLAKPVPRMFSTAVDLPLQTASAHIARAFAQHLGQHLTPDKLGLMFTPQFGMFIAPGCNGLRGAVTMGMVALIAGYFYRFRPHMIAIVSVGAVLLGYLFNFLRLCSLVLYYVFALHFPWFQNKARNADFVIGGTLFLLASILLFTVIQRLRNPAVPVDTPAVALLPSPRGQIARLAALCAVAALGLINYAQAKVVRTPQKRTMDQRFPARLGTYTFVRSWTESLTTGPTVYYWAQYMPENGGTPVAVGVSPMLHWHDPIVCHNIRDEHPRWQGQLTANTATTPVSFSAALYSDGVTQRLQASTQCADGACGEFATQNTRLGLIYTHLNASSLLRSGSADSVPILIKAETTDMSLPADVARRELTATMQSFLSGADLADLARP